MITDFIDNKFEYVSDEAQHIKKTGACFFWDVGPFVVFEEKRLPMEEKMSCVDLNCDLGESFGAYTMGMDEAVIPHVTSVNVACGWHAGDPLIMEKTVALAKKYGVAVGAHPGLPDLMGFGRRPMTVTPEEAGAYVKYQLGALMAFVRGHGMELQHVKPHGALYNMAAKDEALATGICEAIASVDRSIIFMGLAGSVMLEAAKKCGLEVASEVFADRAYNDDGSLVNRKLPGAVIHDPQLAMERAVKMAKEGKVISINGKEISIKADSICVHGDNEKAIELVQNIRKALEGAGIEVRSLK